jgi:outer membrane protein assembly factor BamC
MANRGFEYEESRLEGRAFLVPAGLSTPAFNSNFDIPALPRAAVRCPRAKVDVRSACPVAHRGARQPGGGQCQ